MNINSAISVRSYNTVLNKFIRTYPEVLSDFPSRRILVRLGAVENTVIPLVVHLRNIQYLYR